MDRHSIFWCFLCNLLWRRIFFLLKNIINTQFKTYLNALVIGIKLVCENEHNMMCLHGVNLTLPMLSCYTSTKLELLCMFCALSVHCVVVCLCILDGRNGFFLSKIWNVCFNIVIWLLAIFFILMLYCWHYMEYWLVNYITASNESQ